MSRKAASLIRKLKPGPIFRLAAPKAATPQNFCSNVLIGAASLALAAASAAPARAQHMNDRAGPCTSAGANIEITDCFRQEYDRADRELNDTYRRIMLALDDKEHASLRSAQLSWITYRDKACEAEAEPYRGYSAEGTARLACLAAATRERTRFLKIGLEWKVQKAVEQIREMKEPAGDGYSS